jgi:uncharacterized protein YdhG (YjbR/CyaY superfamily)
MFHSCSVLSASRRRAGPSSGGAESSASAVADERSSSSRAGASLDCGRVSTDEVDEYVRGVEEPKRRVLETLRRTILEIVPEAEQVISYGVPAFRLRGQSVAGFAAFKTHLSYLPFSGSVLGQLADDLDGYTMTKGSLHFPIDRPLPKALVKKLIAVRVADVDRRSH